MKVVRDISELEHLVSAYKSRGESVGFVPTMGALHDGHISLLMKSKEECDLSIVSIYVNPSQFNQTADFESYPRNEEADLQKLAENNCDIAFLPTVSQIERLPLPTGVNLGSLETVMEGSKRPGHFNGVVQVVYRLLIATKPDKAFFGEKDFQQIMVVKKMVADTKLPVSIISCAILRESTGLAMSSRNVRLSEEGKLKAAQIYQVLSGPGLSGVKEKELLQRGFEVEYVEEHNLGGLSRLFTAVWLEGVRLIDNIAID